MKLGCRIIERKQLGLKNQITRAKHLGLKTWEYSDEVPHYENLSYVPKIIRVKLTNKHYNNIFIKAV